MNTLMIRIDHICTCIFSFVLVDQLVLSISKRIPSFEVVQVAFANTAPFREKKLKDDVSINAFLHDVVEFLLKVKI